MRKIAKAHALLLVAATLLTSCSKDSIAGTYSFQMGKESGTHFGIHLKLTDKYTTIESDPETTKKYKECDLTFSIKLGDDTDSFASILELIATLLGQEGDRITINGYYYKGNQVDRDGAIEIKLGVDSSFFKKIFDGVELPQDIEFPVLDPETIEKVVYTTYASNTVTMNIPVSEIDVIYQLYWYGIDFTYSEADGFKIVHLPEEKVHNPGSHPTATDIETINQTYGTDHQAFSQKFGLDLSTYRDYYTLAMGLVKK